MSRLPRLVRVVLLTTLVLAALHLLGGRQSTQALAGIIASPADPVLALLYLATWFFTVLVAPILLIAQALHHLMTRRR